MRLGVMMDNLSSKKAEKTYVHWECRIIDSVYCYNL